MYADTFLLMFLVACCLLPCGVVFRLLGKQKREKVCWNMDLLSSRSSGWQTPLCRFRTQRYFQRMSKHAETRTTPENVELVLELLHIHARATLENQSENGHLGNPIFIYDCCFLLSSAVDDLWSRRSGRGVRTGPGSKSQKGVSERVSGGPSGPPKKSKKWGSGVKKGVNSHWVQVTLFFFTF